VFGTIRSVPTSDTQRSRFWSVYRPLPVVPSIDLLPAISERQIWLIAFGIIAVDLAFFMVPIVPFLAAYVLLARPAWFKDFIDDVYDRS
jgi:hypothetical protein